MKEYMGSVLARCCHLRHKILHYKKLIPFVKTLFKANIVSSRVSEPLSFPHSSARISLADFFPCFCIRIEWRRKRQMCGACASHCSSRWLLLLFFLLPSRYAWRDGTFLHVLKTMSTKNCRFASCSLQKKSVIKLEWQIQISDESRRASEWRKRIISLVLCR